VLNPPLGSSGTFLPVKGSGDVATVTYESATRIYPGSTKPAVDALDLQIEDGEFLVLVGPSGCGKSTCLRMLAGLEEVNSGRILIGDRDVTPMPPKDRDIAMVFQSYALYPHMTVAENMGFALKIAGMSKDEIRKRVQEAAKILDLTEYLERKPKALSGGQRQRVAMGRAIVRQPQVFLMDEPLSNLDAKLRVQTRAEIARLHQRLGTTMIYVTHDQIEAMTMGDRIAVMRDGILQQVGTPQELYDHPVNVFVAGFIGSPSMNFATTKSEGKDLMFGGHKLELAGEQARAADSRPDGASVLIGFRPEHIEIANGQETSAVRIPATVDVVEYLGNDELIHAQSEGNEIVALLPSDKKVAVGDRIDFAVPMEKLHIFDPDSEKTLAG
jgi:multiple sugar transport system ATP-binding protein